MADLPWYIPPLVFAARLTDVSLGTVRVIFVIAGWRYRAAALGFVEVIIWALALGGLVGFITHPVALIAYAAGFATGNLVGITLESRLALGVRMVQAINRNPDLQLSAALRDHGYRVTTLPGQGRDGPVEVALTLVKRKDLPALTTLIQQLNPEAILTIERAETASHQALTNGSPLAKRPSLFGPFAVRK